ncbi:MAG: inositol-3-phosphate synthase, partial [bacterium]
MGEIRVGIVGVGNCASSLVQGLEFYRKADEGAPIPGLMHTVLGGYAIRDVKVVCGFDIDARKVGRDVSEAIFAAPNCALRVVEEMPKGGAPVYKAPVLDGVTPLMETQSPDRRFIPSDEPDVDVVEKLEEHAVDVLVSYLPVGSQLATEMWMHAALEAGTAVVNCIPVFIASHPEWAQRFTKARVPVLGDDIKSQVGATIVHRVLADLFEARGVRIEHTYQHNVGGNTDFLTLSDRARLESKRISKTEAVQSQLHEPLSEEDIKIGPSDYVPFLGDNKVCFIRMEGRAFTDAPLELDLRLSVQDSPNSA